MANYLATSCVGDCLMKVECQANRQQSGTEICSRPEHHQTGNFGITQKICETPSMDSR
jgi:hypothetical protein